MTAITLYTFEDETGSEWGTFQTTNARAAKEYAQRAALRVIENVYEWTEAAPVNGWDFTPEADADIPANQAA